MCAETIRVVHCCLVSVLFTGLCTPAIAIEKNAPNESAGTDSFSRTTLLRRFDKNRDGKLAEREIATLRNAFGGIDVPMLPDKPVDFLRFTRPGYINSSELKQLDNTPEENPLTNAGATLGKVLFYDTHLSGNNTISCASCHSQNAAFADTRRFSVGFLKGHTKRNSMGLSNIRYTNLKGLRPGFFWDERAATLEAQVLMPIQDKVEMGMELKDLEKKLQSLPYYPALFEAAFGSTDVTSDRIGKAVAQFMRSLVSLNSRFDQGAAATKGGDLSADFANFTDQENLGKALFMDGVGKIAEFACAMCHTPPTFNTDMSRNIGLAMKYKDPGLGALKRPSNDPFTPSNDGKFKTPSLRNIALTAPYMHDGRFGTLEQVVEHYSSEVHPHKNVGLALEEMTPGKSTFGFQFSKTEKAALVAFLKTLTDKQFVSDPRFSDPFVRAGK
ncbi:MAG: cytochrome-c peroxidase [Planctomycetes bacterium]|nr:cytochrome-c peroxidase [Planctomycetota bacterium]